MVSKKSESITEKMVSTAARTESLTKTSRLRPAPRVEKSGRATSWAGSVAAVGTADTWSPVVARIDGGQEGGEQDPEEEGPPHPPGDEDDADDQPGEGHHEGQGGEVPQGQGHAGGAVTVCPTSTGTRT